MSAHLLSVHVTRRFVVVACAAVVMLAGAACGGSDHASVAPSATVAVGSTATATVASVGTSAPTSAATIVPNATSAPPATIQLSATPQQLTCDGKQLSEVTARVLDGAGQPVKDGTPVKFSVQALGTADPIDTVTTGGNARTSVTALGRGVGVVVNVTSGAAAAAIRIDCS